MWGLLGTVSGMIGAFSKIGAGGMGKPEMLAKNIGEALVCTASGLMVAITAMGFYFFFRNTLNAVMKDSEGYFTQILDGMMGMGKEFEAMTLAAKTDNPE
jgi:biopolymer transport protein ExbB